VATLLPKANADAWSVSDTETGISSDLLCGSMTFVIGAMWSTFVLSYAIYDSVTGSKLADAALYVSIAVALPIAGYLAFRIGYQTKYTSLYILWFATFTFVIITVSTFARSTAFLFSLVAIYLMTASGSLLLQRRNYDLQKEETISRWMWIPILAAIVAVASSLRLALLNINPYFYWPNQDISMSGVEITRYGPDTGRILRGALVAVIAILLVKLSARYFRNIGRYAQVEKARLPLWILLGVLIGSLLICPLPSFETSHYSAYLGPFHLLRNGGWPLVDVFSQYGLSFLAYLPLGFVLPFNYAAAALVTNVFNIAMLLVAFAIIYTLVGRCKFALPVSAILILVIWLSFPYNANYTPSVFGVRWLPTWTLCWLLVRTTTVRQASARLSAVVLLNVAAVWSLETHLVAVIVFGLHAALVSRIEGSGPWRAVVAALAAIPLSLVGHGLFIAATLIWRGRLPSYGIYFEFFQFYLLDGENNWLLSAKLSIVTSIWLLFAAVYAGILFLALSSFMLGRSLFLPARLLIGLSTLAMAGIAQSIYVLGRPTLPLLALSALPLYTIMICLLVLFIDRVADRRGLKYQLAFCGSACLIALPVGYAWDRIHMPYDGGFLFGSSNASLLVRCIQFSECNPIRELRLIAGNIRDDPPSPVDPSARRQIADLVTLYRKWQSAVPSIAVVTLERTAVLIKLGVEDALRANNFAEDFVSPTLMKHYAASLERMPAGSLIMTANATGPFETSLLCGLLRRHRFERVDSAGDISADRLVPLDYEFEMGSPLAQIDGKTFLRLKDGSLVPVKARQTGLSAGFIEQFQVRRHTAIVSGWAIDPSTLAPAKTVVLTLHNRIWGLVRPGIARSDIVGTNRNFLKSGFRLHACDVSPSDLADFHAYAWTGSGPAIELEYSPEVPPTGWR